MAGLSGLPYFIQYQGELQNQALQRQQAQQQLMQFQQAQQDRQRQQAAQAALGNTYANLPIPPQQTQQPAPQPPFPGQASQPAPQQPQGGVPLPQGPVPGLRPPLPPGGAQGAMPPSGVPPFRPMPTTPPVSAAPQGAIPAPPAPTAVPAQQPQGGGMTWEQFLKSAKDQGLSGVEMFQYMQMAMPVLDYQAKQQAAAAQIQFSHEIQLARLQETADYHEQLSKDKNLSLEERTRHDQASEQLRSQAVGLQAQAIKLRLQQGDDSKLSPDEAKVMGEQLAKGDTSVLSNLGRGTQGAANVVAVRKAALQYAKDNGLSGGDLAANIAGFQGEKAAARTGATRATNIGIASEEAAQTFPLVRQTSAALPRTEFVPANRALQAAETNTGDPKVIAFGTALNTAINAYARAISPTGTPTVSDKEHARQILSTANTPEQVDAALNIMEKEMSAARSAPAAVQAQQRARISGKSAAPSSAPAVGTVDSGYRFKGGDPASPSSWERVQ